MINHSELGNSRWIRVQERQKEERTREVVRQTLFDAVRKGENPAEIFEIYVAKETAIVPLSVTLWAERTGQDVPEARAAALQRFFAKDVASATQSVTKTPEPVR